MNVNKAQAIRLGAAVTTMAVVLALIIWRSNVPPFHPGADSFGFDPSDSQELALACDKVVAVARADMSDPTMGSGARIFLFRMGDATTAHDPVLMDTFVLPDTTTVMGGPNAAIEKQKELETRIRERCKQIPTTTVSPLFQGAKRMVEFVQQEYPQSVHRSEEHTSELQSH